MTAFLSREAFSCYKPEVTGSSIYQDAYSSYICLLILNV